MPAGARLTWPRARGRGTSASSAAATQLRAGLAKARVRRHLQKMIGDDEQRLGRAFARAHLGCLKRHVQPKRDHLARWMPAPRPLCPRTGSSRSCS